MTQEIKLIGWFDPDYSGPSNSTGYTVAADRQYIYYDVFAFTARVQTRLNTSGTEQKAKAVLPNCLCNAARIWYNDMSDHERDLLKNVSHQVSLSQMKPPVCLGRFPDPTLCR